MQSGCVARVTIPTNSTPSTITEMPTTTSTTTRKTMKLVKAATFVCETLRMLERDLECGGSSLAGLPALPVLPKSIPNVPTTAPSVPDATVTTEKTPEVVSQPTPTNDTTPPHASSPPNPSNVLHKPITPHDQKAYVYAYENAGSIFSNNGPTGDGQVCPSSGPTATTTAISSTSVPKPSKPTKAEVKQHGAGKKEKDKLKGGHGREGSVDASLYSLNGGQSSTLSNSHYNRAGPCINSVRRDGSGGGGIGTGTAHTMHPMTHTTILPPSIHTNTHNPDSLKQHKGLVEPKEAREYKEPKEHKSHREPREHKESRDVRDIRMEVSKHVVEMRALREQNRMLRDQVRQLMDLQISTPPAPSLPSSPSQKQTNATTHTQTVKALTDACVGTFNSYRTESTQTRPSPIPSPAKPQDTVQPNSIVQPPDTTQPPNTVHQQDNTKFFKQALKTLRKLTDTDTPTRHVVHILTHILTSPLTSNSFSHALTRILKHYTALAHLHKHTRTNLARVYKKTRTVRQETERAVEAMRDMYVRELYERDEGVCVLIDGLCQSLASSPLTDTADKVDCENGADAAQRVVQEGTVHAYTTYTAKLKSIVSSLRAESDSARAMCEKWESRAKDARGECKRLAKRVRELEETVVEMGCERDMARVSVREGLKRRDRHSGSDKNSGENQSNDTARDNVSEMERVFDGYVKEIHAVQGVSDGTDSFPPQQQQQQQQPQQMMGMGKMFRLIQENESTSHQLIRMGHVIEDMIKKTQELENQVAHAQKDKQVQARASRAREDAIRKEQQDTEAKLGAALAACEEARRVIGVYAIQALRVRCAVQGILDTATDAADAGIHGDMHDVDDVNNVQHPFAFATTITKLCKAYKDLEQGCARTTQQLSLQTTRAHETQTKVCVLEEAVGETRQQRDVLAEEVGVLRVRVGELERGIEDARGRVEEVEALRLCSEAKVRKVLGAYRAMCM